jgi:type IX secretion system PorP/SprF family membrane protein
MIWLNREVCGKLCKFHLMKNWHLFLSGLFLLTFYLQTASAQDPQLAQFSSAPLLTNPALTGVFDGEYRIHVNYREQWGVILKDRLFRTVAAGFDWRMPVGRGDYAGFGLVAMRDQTGDGRFTQNRVHLSGAFMKELSGNGYRTADQYLIAGGQIGFGQHALEWGNLWFSNQFDNLAVRPDLTLSPNDPGINTDRANLTYADANVGIMYYAVFDERFSVYLGGAAHHLNTPKISFSGGEEELAMRVSVQAGGELPVTDEVSILPGVLFVSQGPSMQTLAGAAVRFSNYQWGPMALRVGAWARMTNRVSKEPETVTTGVESVVAMAFLELEALSIGLSYDITATDLTTVNSGRGAFELSLIYRQPPARRRPKVSCPNF